MVGTSRRRGQLTEEGQKVSLPVLELAFSNLNASWFSKWRFLRYALPESETDTGKHPDEVVVGNCF